MRLPGALTLSVLAGAWLFGQNLTESSALVAGKVRTCDLPAGQSQEHTLLLRAGEYARLEVAQHTVNVAVEVVDPTGKPLFTLDNSSIGESEDVELIAPT